MTDTGTTRVVTDNDKLEEFLASKVDVDLYSGQFYGMESFTLSELKELQELAKWAIIERLCEYSPAVFEPIFSCKIKEN